MSKSLLRFLLFFGCVSFVFACSQHNAESHDVVATPAIATTGNANPTGAPVVIPPAPVQQEEGVSVDQSENEISNGAGPSSSDEELEEAGDSSSSDSNQVKADEKQHAIEFLNELHGIFGNYD
jgi:hypothetical protein